MAMTNQEIFDKVARHLLTQGKQCRAGATGVCLYRGENGLACAVGCLIPNEAYSPDIEETSMAEVIGGSESAVALSETLDAIGIHEDQFSLLRALQETHDSCKPANWASRLREIATCQSLSPAVLNEFPETTTA